MRVLEPQKLAYNRPNIGPHKGDNGRVLVVGGSPPYVGAVYLAAMAALRAGADVVRIAAPKRVAYAINELSADLITLKFRSLSIFAYPKIKKELERSDVMLIGNGLGTAPRWLVRALVRHPILKVIDADALKVISLKNVQNAILTPHMGEFKILYESTTGEKLPDEDDARLAVRGMTMLKKYGNNSVILLKGPTDYVITKQELIENPRGNPRMRVAGTGDVLAGAIAGILAQTKQMMLSISVALPAVTITADQLYNQKGGSYTASDMLATLHKAIFK